MGATGILEEVGTRSSASRLPAAGASTVRKIALAPEEMTWCNKAAVAGRDLLT